MARRASEQPTDGELEILRVLWDRGPSELGAVRAALEEGRPVAATTVATMLKVMLQKGLVDRADGPRGYLWSARLGRKAARNGLIGKVLHAAFGGSASRLVAHLIESGKLSARDREEICRLLEAGRSRENPRRKGPKP